MDIPTAKFGMLEGLSLVLASASPRRARLLQQAGIDFRVIEPKVEEKMAESCPFFTPAELALNNAYLKACQVAASHPSEWVLAADTVVVIQGEILGKPRDLEHARRMFELLNGKTHQVITAVFILRGDPFHQLPFYEMSRVTFNKLAARDRDRYLEAIDPLDKAGAYAVQEKHDLLIEKIEGSFSNVMGLPLEKLLDVLPRLQRHTRKEAGRL